MIDYQENGLNFKLNPEDFTAHIIRSRNARGNIYIPLSVSHDSHNYIITKILSESFKNNNLIKSIEFSTNSKLTTIENKSFYGSSLEIISIPSSVNELEEGWCFGCLNLTKVKISPDNKNFRYLDANEQIIVGKSNPDSQIYDDIIFASRDITTVTVPTEIKRIKSYSFHECEFLKTVNFSEKSSLESICKDSFAYSSIEKVCIPSSVKIIGDGAFAWCQKLQTIEFEEDSQLISIGKLSFSKSSLQKITIPKKMRIIGEATFSWCPKLETIEIPDDSELMTIDKYAFYGSNIKFISISSSVEELKDGWCRYTPKLSRVFISEKNKRYSVHDEKMIVGKSEPNIEGHDVLVFVFRNVSQIVIPSFIKHISSYAFQGCENLTKIEFEENSSLLYIGKGTFANSFIKSITIPKSVKIIDEESFCRCYNLKTITFSEDSELAKIGNNAFNDSSIKSLMIPSNVEELQEGWCRGTSDLAEIVISPDNKHYQYLDSKKQIVIEMNNNSFENLVFASRDIKTAKIPSFIKHIKPFSFNKCKSIETVSFSESSSLESIENESFSYSSIRDIFIPKNVERIGESAFSNCTNLKTAKLDRNSKLTVISKDAFSYSSLQRISIPSHVKQICEGAFSFCRDLEKIEIDENSELRLIEKRAFQYSSIKSIVIPKTVKRINEFTFFCCANLRSIEFLGDHAFIDHCCVKECTGLLFMSFPNSRRVSIVYAPDSIDSGDFSIFISPCALLVSVNE